MTNISLWEDSQLTTQWKDTQILSYDEIKQEVLLKTGQLYQQKFVYLVVMNEGGYKAVIELQVAVVPAPVPPSDCTPNDVSLN